MPDRQVALSPPLPGITGQLQALTTGEAAAVAAANPYKRRSLRAAFTAGWRHVPRLAEVGPAYQPAFNSDQESKAFWAGAEARTEFDRDRHLRTHKTNHQEVHGLCPRKPSV